MKYLLFLSLSVICLQAMTLSETVDYALQNNNALKQTNVSSERSKSVRSAKQAQKYGRVDVIASYDHYNLSRTLAPLTPMSIVGSPDGAYTIPTTQDLFTTGIAYNVILFNGFAQQSAYKISDLQYQSSLIKRKLAREELIYNVRTLYLSLLALEEQLKAQGLYTQAQSQLVLKIQKGRELGSKSKLDLLRAQNSVAASLAQENTMGANIDILKATLSALMGNKTFNKTEPLTITMPKSKSFVIEESNITSLKRYQATKINQKVNAKKRDQAKSSYYPVIDFGAYYGQNFGPNDTTNSVPPTSTAPSAGTTVLKEGDYNSAEIWQLGVHLKWNVLDFGLSRSKNEEAKLAYLESQLQSAGVAIEVRKNLLIAHNKIKLAVAKYKSAASQYALLDETSKIEQIRYDNDALTITDLLATRAKKEIAYAQMIDAKYSYQKALYYLDYLLEKGEEK
ncbi:TolC family protein [Sulfurimonas sp.]|uniref:TolC family protein n=1 Tax=Sulfurimonas sp. TaxID=2022749 RepID=UPI0026202D0C|nr:TolC family protein [Sulfurimonas sp.]